MQLVDCKPKSRVIGTSKSLASSVPSVSAARLSSEEEEEEDADNGEAAFLSARGSSCSSSSGRSASSSSFESCVRSVERDPFPSCSNTPARVRAQRRKERRRRQRREAALELMEEQRQQFVTAADSASAVGEGGGGGAAGDSDARSSRCSAAGSSVMHRAGTAGAKFRAAAGGDVGRVGNGNGGDDSGLYAAHAAASMHWRGRFRIAVRRALRGSDDGETAAAEEDGGGATNNHNKEREEEEEDVVVPLTLATVHDWDNLKNPDGYTHFMMANASFEAGEAEDMLVLSWVPERPIPLDGTTVLACGATPVPWDVEVEVLPRPLPPGGDPMEELWRFCGGPYGGATGEERRWVRVSGFSVAPMFCVGCVQKRAPNRKVAEWLSKQPARTVAPRACIVGDAGDVEAVVNPTRTMCCYFKVRSDGSKKRDLGQIDIFLRSNDLFDPDRLEAVPGDFGDGRLCPPSDETEVVFSRYVGTQQRRRRGTRSQGEGSHCGVSGNNNGAKKSQQRTARRR